MDILVVNFATIDTCDSPWGALTKWPKLFDAPWLLDCTSVELFRPEYYLSVAKGHLLIAALCGILEYRHFRGPLWHYFSPEWRRRDKSGGWSRSWEQRTVLHPDHWILLFVWNGHAESSALRRHESILDQLGPRVLQGGQRVDDRRTDLHEPPGLEQRFVQRCSTAQRQKQLRRLANLRKQR